MTYQIDIERVFIIILASWGILVTCLSIWQQSYMHRIHARHYRPRCAECGSEMLDEWYCPRCEKE